MQEEKQCPKCRKGTLGKMTDKELAKIGLWDRVVETGEEILGCDECRHMEHPDGSYVMKANGISMMTSEPIAEDLKKVRIVLHLVIIKDNEAELKEDIGNLIKKFNF